MQKVLLLLWVFTLAITTTGIAQNSDLYASPSERKSIAADYYEKGNRASKREQFPLAVVYYDSAIRLYGGNSDYYFARGQAKELADNNIGALADFEAALRIDPQHYTAMFKRALVYLKQKNYKQAAQDFTFLINNVETFETKAIVFKGASYDEKGEMIFSGIATLEDMMADVYLARAQTYEQMGFSTPTMLDYDKAISLNNHEPNYYVHRGLFKLKKEDAAGAEADFRNALEIDQFHRLALYNLSFLVDADEKNEIDKILYGVGDFAMAYSRRAFENYQKGNYEEALLDYDSALQIKRDNANDLMNRGMVKAKLDRHKDAIKDFETSVYTDNTLTRNFVLIGNSFQELNNYPQAVTYYQRYLRSGTGDGVVYYNLGLAYMKAKKDDLACEALRKAYDLGEERAEPALEQVCFRLE
ncbi:MAG: tetratricopeptide repeat protein [Reichenbachiella sp.]|uniref:tetratricopeptide repeat protein n=1 Tax=Reichenbachiella sp. TaxID=2184521 RepID=UPI0032641904